MTCPNCLNNYKEEVNLNIILTFLLMCIVRLFFFLLVIRLSFIKYDISNEIFNFLNRRYRVKIMFELMINFFDTMINLNS